ncbi:MAG: 23S rRNA (guanosine(2251)-2'-O)-methyltransferase RlmB [Candidatus Latescibacteria bacterium]|nr:23S rRNA (guanosine(2251)-2'-O)-methyltransferase RlmB [Candidatus Latescibacterota bacterium]
MPDLIYGINPLRAALEEKPERIHKLFVIRGRRNSRVEEVVMQARNLGVPLVFQPREALDRMTGSASHQGLVARVATTPFTDFEEMVAAAAKKETPLLVALDHVQDPHNLGAVVRSAEALGVDGIIVPRHRSAVPGPAAEKAAAGALWRVPLCRVPNLSRAITRLKDLGLWVVGTAADEGSPPWELDLTGPLVVVIGGEEKGVRPAVRSSCDFLASIPLRGQTASLNASVAAGIVFYEIVRQRSVLLE